MSENLESEVFSGFDVDDFASQQYEARRHRQPRVSSLSDLPNEVLILFSIPIHERVELPESWIPADSRVVVLCWVDG